MTLDEKCRALTAAAAAQGCTCAEITFTWSWLDPERTRMRIVVGHQDRCPVLLRHRAALN